MVFDKFKVTRSVRAELPALKFPRKTLKVIGVIYTSGIIDNIKKQQQADGSQIKRNTPKWAQRKVDKGWLYRGRLLSLVAKQHRFIDDGTGFSGSGGSWKFIEDPRKQQIHVTPGSTELERLSKWVQQKGYTGWFAMSRETQRKIQGVVREHIEDEFKKAQKRNAKKLAAAKGKRPKK